MQVILTANNIVANTKKGGNDETELFLYYQTKYTKYQILPYMSVVANNLRKRVNEN